MTLYPNVPNILHVKYLIKCNDAIFFYFNSRFNCQPNTLKHLNIRCEQVDSSKIDRCKKPIKCQVKLNY